MKSVDQAISREINRDCTRFREALIRLVCSCEVALAPPPAVLANLTGFSIEEFHAAQRASIAEAVRRAKTDLDAPGWVERSLP